MRRRRKRGAVVVRRRRAVGFGNGGHGRAAPRRLCCVEGEGAGLLPVVGDEGEVLEVDEAVEVEVAGGGVAGCCQWLVMRDWSWMSMMPLSLASPRWLRETRREFESKGWPLKVVRPRTALSKRVMP